MTVIYLIRHGQASFGQQNYDNLSDLGQQQAGILGEQFKQRVGAFQQIYTGSMLRHHQTAAACLGAMEQHDGHQRDNWSEDPNWNEYDHQDILTQLGEEFVSAERIQQYLRSKDDPKAAFEAVFNQAMERWLSGRYDDDYVESWPSYQQRIKDGLNKVVQNSRGASKVAVFSSGGPIAVISQHLLGVDPAQVMQMNWTLVNGSVTKLVSTPSRLFLSTLNDHSHFEGKAKHLITYK